MIVGELDIDSVKITELRLKDFFFHNHPKSFSMEHFNERKCKAEVCGEMWRSWARWWSRSENVCDEVGNFGLSHEGNSGKCAAKVAHGYRKESESWHYWGDVRNVMWRNSTNSGNSRSHYEPSLKRTSIRLQHLKWWSLLSFLTKVKLSDSNNYWTLLNRIVVAICWLSCLNWGFNYDFNVWNQFVSSRL